MSQQYDMWKSDVGPWPSQEQIARCFCCHKELKDWRRLVCRTRTCEDWLRDMRRRCAINEVFPNA